MAFNIYYLLRLLNPDKKRISWSFLNNQNSNFFLFQLKKKIKIHKGHNNRIEIIKNPQESNNDNKMDSLTVGVLTSETKLALESPFIIYM